VHVSVVELLMVVVAAGAAAVLVDVVELAEVVVEVVVEVAVLMEHPVPVFA